MLSLLSFHCKVINLHLGGGSKDEDREEREKKQSLTWSGKGMKQAAKWSVDKEMQPREMKHGKAVKTLFYM